jgi:hypothetical protein
MVPVTIIPESDSSNREEKKLQIENLQALQQT